VKKDAVLISIASWADEFKQCHLAIDWESLGFNPEKAELVAPHIKDFQHSEVFKPNETIPVEPGKGWLLILKNHHIGLDE
jgi:hypothetical protein